jgi:hypothetical protein
VCASLRNYRLFIVSLLAEFRAYCKSATWRTSATDFSEAEIDVIQNGEYVVLARNGDTIRAPDIAGYLFSKNMYSYPIVHVDCSAQYC